MCVTNHARPARSSTRGAPRTPRRGGRVALEVTCHTRGIRFTHSGPYHPQTCGKVERFHQTLKKWLDRQPRPATVRQLQVLLDRFGHNYYNTLRPHRALHRRTPQQAYTARPKAVPTPTLTIVLSHQNALLDGLIHAAQLGRAHARAALPPGLPRRPH